MKFVITGGLGHIGSLLIRKLDCWYPNSNIVIIDNLHSERYCSLFNLPKAAKKYFINENLCDLELQNIFKNSRYTHTHTTISHVLNVYNVGYPHMLGVCLDIYYNNHQVYISISQDVTFRL